MTDRIPLSRPEVGHLELDRLARVLESGRLALGPQTAEFEKRIAQRAGTAHAVAVSSGTAALHLIVRALGIGDGDEVITTPYSFVASANAPLFERARPVFVDIDPVTLNIDPGRVEDAITPKTRAILAVDVFGLPAPWQELTDIANRRGLRLIDDACEAFGATLQGQPIGSWGDAAAFGFYPNKQITTGEGGCITTGDASIADLCRSMRNQGRQSDAWMSHHRLGFNYRMSELSAAVGCAQLDRFDDLQGRRERVAGWYDECLSAIGSDLAFPARPMDAARSWFAFVVRLKEHFSPEARDELISILRGLGIESAPYFPAIHLQPFYRERFGYGPGAFPVAEAASERTLALPFFPSLTEQDVDRVCDSLKTALEQVARREGTASAAEPAYRLPRA
jgi:perosamine synthetase